MIKRKIKADRNENFSIELKETELKITKIIVDTVLNCYQFLVMDYNNYNYIPVYCNSNTKLIQVRNYFSPNNLINLLLIANSL